MNKIIKKIKKILKFKEKQKPKKLYISLDNDSWVELVKKYLEGLDEKKEWVIHIKKLFSIISHINICITYKGLELFETKGFKLLLKQGANEINILRKIKIKNKHDQEVYLILMNIMNTAMDYQTQKILNLAMRQQK